MRFEPSRKTLRGSALAVVSALAVLATLPASAGELIRRDTAAGTLDARRVVVPSVLTEGVQARETVRIDATVLAAGPETLWLELAPGEWRLAFLGELERRDGGLVWRGRFAEDGSGYHSITLTVDDGVVYGSLEAGGVRYALRPAAGGATVLTTVAADRPLRCAVGAEDGLTEDGLAAAAEPWPADAAPGEAATAGRETAAAAAGPRLHVVILYLPSLGDAWGGQRFAVAYGHHAIDTLNTAFRNSRIDATAVLAAVQEWQPSGFFNGNITQLPNRAASDATVAAVRDHAGGDLVVILADDATTYGGCGYGNLMTRARFGPQFASQAFSTTNVDCEGRDHLIFAHEIGHNLGGQHNPEVTVPTDLVFPYALGYVGNAVTTIMTGWSTPIRR